MSNEKSVMERIAEANKPVTAGVDEKDIKHWVTIRIMGKAYRVPSDLTILTAMEFAGYRFVRGVGCRQGFCGACGTVYRKEGEYKLKTGLACQTRVEDGMYLVQIPFSPAQKAIYDIKKERYNVSTILKYYPEVAKCVSCNTCTKACPQDIEVMDYVQAALRGNYEKVAETSFDCIRCGLCAMRCPAEIVQYDIGQLGRRMYGRYGMDKPDHLKIRLKELEEKKFDPELDKLEKATKEELVKFYAAREREKD